MRCNIAKWTVLRVFLVFLERPCHLPHRCCAVYRLKLAQALQARCPRNAEIADLLGPATQRNENTAGRSLFRGSGASGGGAELGRKPPGHRRRLDVSTICGFDSPDLHSFNIGILYQAAYVEARSETQNLRKLDGASSQAEKLCRRVLVWLRI